MTTRTLLASEIIARLSALIAEYGDREVFIDDADTGWSLPIQPDGIRRAREWENTPSAFMIEGEDYSSAVNDQRT